MKFLFIFLLSFLAVLSCYPQESTAIIGKWKLIAVSDDEFYHNFEKDSTTLSAAREKEFKEEGKNIQEGIKLVKDIMNSISANSYYVFGNDSSYEFASKNAVIERGKFIVENKIIITTSAKSAKDNVVKRNGKLTIIKREEDALVLSMQMEEGEMIFYLKRAF